MQKLNIELRNCYWIKSLSHEFSFENSNVNLIYAKNWSMKTSFAKTFKKLQEWKENEICDEIFWCEPVVKDIKIDWKNINKDDIFVIKSFENSYESDSVSSLLINNELKEKLWKVLVLKNNFLKTLVTKSGLKISKTSWWKEIFELEPQILKDFSKNNKSFLQILDDINFTSISNNFSLIEYNSIFSDSILKKIKTNEFQNNIQEFLDKSDEIYWKEEFSFLEKWKFTLWKLKDLHKKIKSNNFFVKNNKIIFDWNINIENIWELDNKIKEIEDELQNTTEFKKLEKLFQDVWWIKLKDIIENNPDIIRELKLINIEKFRKNLWLSYFKNEEEKLNELKDKYNELKEEIDELNIDDTLWKKSIDIFNSRFSLPFKMDIENLKSSIIGENKPKIIFNFCKDWDFENLSPDNWKNFNRPDLDWKDILSQWEKRALYLLNIIFDIEKFKNEISINSDFSKLLIIDDIADSFDYKNKYAIIEYLRENSEIDNFKMVILSHNFDFYRTISSRISMSRKNKFHVIKTISDEIKIEKEEYQWNPFETWKNILLSRSRYGIQYTSLDAKKHIIALIPFVRNIIEYWVDKRVNDFSSINEDFIFLTNLCHLKNETWNITFWNLKKVYKEYIWKDNFDTSLIDNDKVYDLIIDIADNYISDTDIKLENKIILAIAIRLESERFMKDKISWSNFNFSWFEWIWRSKTPQNWNQSTFLTYINGNWNQTTELFKGYKQIWDSSKIKILESVNIMTPENIHLNSFMYEPILDMDIIELKNLYNKVKDLNNN